MRKFAQVSRFEEGTINLPKRATKYAAGYDFEVAETVTIPKMTEKDPYPVKVPTGVKAYMPKNEYLKLASRSSNSKLGLVIPHGVGIVDADYVDNEANEGEILFVFYNFGPKDVVLEKGQRIGQGIFQTFLLTDDDIATGSRNGGFGSTN